MATGFEFDKYLEHSKEEAYRIHQDEKNFSSLRVFILIFCIIIGFMLVTTFFDGSIDYDSYSTFVAFAVSLILRIFYYKIFKVEIIRKTFYFLFVGILIAFLFSAILENFVEGGKQTDEPKKELVKEKSNDEKGGLQLTVNTAKRIDTTSIVIFFVISLLFFRLPKSDLTQLYALAIGLPILTDLIFFQNYSFTSKLPGVIIGILCYIIATSTEGKKQRKFFRDYTNYFKRHSDNIRMKKELNYAREMQLSMLPENIKSIGDLNIAAISNPASEVGGDYYDYFQINEHTTGIFICDVSGHGVASALLLSGLRSCMHLILEDTSNPKIVFDKLNRVVRKTQNKKMFVTAIFAVIDTLDNKCTLFNAGHLPPYKISDDFTELFKIKKHGITLGAIDKFIDENEEEVINIDFNKGDKLFLYTDGVVEAMNSAKDEYGFERLENFLYENAKKSPSVIIEKLMSDIKTFSGNTEQVDDISILVISRNKE